MKLIYTGEYGSAVFKRTVLDLPQVGRVEVPPLKGGQPPPPIPGCTTKPQPCPSHPGVTFCISDPASGQCDRPMPHKPCPPCPAPPSTAKKSEEQREHDAVFFSWNRAHFGGTVLSLSFRRE